MVYKGYEIHAKRARNDFGNWFAIAFPLPPTKGNSITINFDLVDYVETRREVYRLMRVRIDEVEVRVNNKRR